MLLLKKYFFYFVFNFKVLDIFLLVFVLFCLFFLHIFIHFYLSFSFSNFIRPTLQVFFLSNNENVLNSFSLCRVCMCLSVCWYIFGGQTNGDNATVCVEPQRPVPPPAPAIKTHTHTPPPHVHAQHLPRRSARTRSPSHSLSLTPHKTEFLSSVSSAELSSDVTWEAWTELKRIIF